MKKVIKWIIIIFVVLFVGSAAIAGIIEGIKGEDEDADAVKESSNKDETVKKEEVKEEEEEKEEKLTLDEQVEKIVKDTLGEKTNIVEIDVRDHMGTIEIEDDKFVSITLVGNQNLSTNMTKKGMWLDSIEVLEEMFKIEEIGKVWIEWQYPLVDKYGNEDLVEVMNIDMTREIADKINWENFPIDNLKEVVDTYYEHPALSKK
ncbi:hypothetical protein GOQ29_09425 [Clostridium sp. D2Q-14]|uniref:hypothetical protein n=1 Tax=Anaeromonas gelatinilytica TaxID=2683194 RepID=UPI00193B61A0|nr:hypothetical protein [Anaeromonas gelatinilytica]MBS4535834.1 hypothetical protein [Anaeromonas gelatinilytica]